LHGLQDLEIGHYSGLEILRGNTAIFLGAFKIPDSLPEEVPKHGDHVRLLIFRGEQP
jgi:hypothetical protein